MPDVDPAQIEIQSIVKINLNLFEVKVEINSDDLGPIKLVVQVNAQSFGHVSEAVVLKLRKFGRAFQIGLEEGL